MTVSARGAALVIIASLALSVWQLPRALSRDDWDRRAAVSRQAEQRALEDASSTQTAAAKTEAEIADQLADNESIRRRLARQKKAIAELEERVRELGGDPDDL